MTTTETGERIEVVNNEAGHYYELLIDGASAGLVVYEPFGTRQVLTHTYVDPAYRGRGMSWRLMSGVLDDVRANHQTVTNQCPVLDRFFQANPEYADLLDEARPGAWPDRRRQSA